jgi:N-acetyl-gamma-glutamyl-phosphate reductase
MINIGIIGGTGYTAGELLRILLHHPKARLQFVYSASQAGKSLASVHPDLLGETDLLFTGTPADADVLFLCLGHGLSEDFLTRYPQKETTKIIDLGNDFRLKTQCGNRRFVYGLPEAYHEDVAEAQNIANPGCFATAIQLALLPLAQQRLLH